MRVYAYIATFESLDLHTWVPGLRMQRREKTKKRREAYMRAVLN